MKVNGRLELGLEAPKSNVAHSAVTRPLAGQVLPPQTCAPACAVAIHSFWTICGAAFDNIVRDDFNSQFHAFEQRCLSDADPLGMAWRFSLFSLFSRIFRFDLGFLRLQRSPDCKKKLQAGFNESFISRIKNVCKIVSGKLN